MILYRVESRRRAQSAFSGEGGLHVAGRWNSLGSRLVYTSSSLALACLEKRVHLVEAPPAGAFVWFSIDVPDDAIAAPPELPPRWDAIPPEPATGRIGDEFLRAARAVGLRVPSVLVPTEFNVLLNPAHADFAACPIRGPHDFHWDGRLFG